MLGTKTSIGWIVTTFAVSLLLITAFILIPSTAISAPARSSVLPSLKPLQWPNSVFENFPALNQPITTTHKILPSRVFVIENRELVTQLPSIAISQPKSTSENTIPDSGTTIARVTILPSRQIVVDNNDNIVEVWSNTSGTDCAFYSLSAWQDKLNGVEHPMTLKILSQYNKKLRQLDWNRRGEVY
jgi:hypothetical protein